MISVPRANRQPPAPEPPPVPSQHLLRRTWHRGPNRERILFWAARLERLPPRARAFFEVGVRLEEGDLPWIEQGGVARFDPVEAADPRVLNLAEEGGERGHVEPENTGGSAVGATEGSPAGCPAAEAEEAEARASVRWGEPVRAYPNVGAAIDEDRWELGVSFPGFSPVVWDPDLALWYREGVIHPLLWWPEGFAVRLYYEQDPRALPLVRVSPPPPVNAPHQFRMIRNGRQFNSVCYTFAPDGTLVRGRGWDDTASEALRQVVMWLLRYMVWKRFGFYPGEDVGHDPRLLLLMAPPDGPCPYHAQNRYDACCRTRHTAEAASMPPLSEVT